MSPFDLDHLRISDPPPSEDAAAALGLVARCTSLLYANGQTTQMTVGAAMRVGRALGYRVEVHPNWNMLILRLENAAGTCHEILTSEPAGVEMRKVAATMGVVEAICAGRMTPDAARAELSQIDHFAPPSLVRFALMAAAGAAALGVIFGAYRPATLIVIALSAGLGACLRRWLAGVSRNLFIQPFCAALLAGLIGAVVARSSLDTALRLVAVCPCMVLVPGPHLLNGAMDFARARIPLGLSRLTYATLIVVVISAGLILGLAGGGVSLPASGPAQPVPLGYDVLAAGVAVAAYGTFFAMRWRILPIPIAVGMIAHASRWAVITVGGANAATGALLACLIVGFVMTPIADGLRLPFAGLAFASVVSMIPGVYLFRMAGGMVELVTLGPQAPLDLFAQVNSDGVTALLIVVAMTFGLAAPRIFLENFFQSRDLAAQGAAPLPNPTHKES